jgi:hypothetical protein
MTTTLKTLTAAAALMLAANAAQAQGTVSKCEMFSIYDRARDWRFNLKEHGYGGETGAVNAIGSIQRVSV